MQVLLVLAGLLLLAGWWATRPDVVRGRVVDYDTGAPVGQAEVRAYRSGGFLGIKSYSGETTTDDDGRFSVEIRGSGPVNLNVGAEGRHTIRGRFAPRRALTVYLKAQEAAPGALYRAYGAGRARVGVDDRGRAFGWSFVDEAVTFDPNEADLFPVDFSADQPQTFRLRAHPGGGIACRPLADLGLDGDIYKAGLIYTDEAPAEGYDREVTIPTAEGGAVCFVRTRDGRRYAKVETEAGRGGWTDGGVSTAEMAFQYVYGYFAGRTLPFSEAVFRREIAAAALDLDDAPADATAARRIRIEVWDPGDRLIDHVELVLRPGERATRTGTPHTDWPAYRYEGVAIALNERGLPLVTFTLISDHVAIHYNIGVSVNTRFGVRERFTDYMDSGASDMLRPVERVMQIRMLPLQSSNESR